MSPIKESVDIPREQLVENDRGASNKRGNHGPQLDVARLTRVIAMDRAATTKP